MKIKGKEYNLKFTLRAMMIFEGVTQKPFQLNNITDEYIYLYCMIMANYPDANITFDDLIDAMDQDPSIMEEFKSLLESYVKKKDQFPNEETDVKKKF